MARPTLLHRILALGVLLWTATAVASADAPVVLLEPGFERLSLTPHMEYLDKPFASFLPPAGMASADFVGRDALRSRLPASGWHWQRITLKSGFDRPTQIFLAMAPYWADDIRVYRLDGGVFVQLARHGDMVPWTERELPGRKHFQPLRLLPGEEITLYLGFQVLGPRIPNVRLYESTSLWDFGIRQDLIIGAAVSTMLLSGLAFLLVGLGLRMAPAIIYGAAVLLSGVQVAARYGVIEALYSGTTPLMQHLANWIGGLGGAILILEASLRVFSIHETRPLAYRTIWVLIGCALASGAVTYSWFAPYWTTVPYQILGIAAFVTMGLIVTSIWRESVRAFLLVCAAAFIIRLLGFLVEIYTAASVVDLGEEGFSGVLPNSIMMVILLNIAMGLLVHTAIGDRDRAQDEARRAVRRWQDQRELISMLSHEFRNPLAAISRSAQMLLSHPDFDPERRLTGIRSSADKLYSLVDRLLAVESFEFRRDMLKRQPTVLGALIQRCINDSQEPARIRFQQVTPNMLVSADEQLLSLAIGNLLDNALKFSPPDMLVAVRLASVDGQGCVIITDQGCGIEPADLEQLGTPYYRAELSRQVPGLGLGFLLARRIIESHGGTLSVESTPGQGTTVTVTLQE